MGWIQKLKKGALTKKAKAKGMTPAQFCAQPEKKLSTKSKRQ